MLRVLCVLSMFATGCSTAPIAGMMDRHDKKRLRREAPNDAPPPNAGSTRHSQPPSDEPLNINEPPLPPRTAAPFPTSSSGDPTLLPPAPKSDERVFD